MDTGYTCFNSELESQVIRVNCANTGTRKKKKMKKYRTKTTTTAVSKHIITRI
jgi:hypothetical protein